MNTAWLIPVLPLLGFLFNLLFGKKAGKGAVSFVALGTVTLSFVLSVSAFLYMKVAPGQRLEIHYRKRCSRAPRG